MNLNYRSFLQEFDRNCPQLALWHVCFANVRYLHATQKLDNFTYTYIYHGHAKMPKQWINMKGFGNALLQVPNGECCSFSAFGFMCLI